MLLGDEMKSMKNCKNFWVEAHKITIQNLSKCSPGSYYYYNGLIRVDRWIFCKKLETYERWTVVAVIFLQGFSIFSHFNRYRSLRRKPFSSLSRAKLPFCKDVLQISICCCPPYSIDALYWSKLYIELGTKFPKETELKRTKFSALERNQNQKFEWRMIEFRSNYKMLKKLASHYACTSNPSNVSILLYMNSSTFQISFRLVYLHFTVYLGHRWTWGNRTIFIRLRIWNRQNRKQITLCITTRRRIVRIY